MQRDRLSVLKSPLLPLRKRIWTFCVPLAKCAGRAAPQTSTCLPLRVDVVGSQIGIAQALNDGLGTRAFVIRPLAKLPPGGSTSRYWSKLEIRRCL